MIDKLFRKHPPQANSAVLDPGCGEGAFIHGIVRWCQKHRKPLPHIVGVESDPRRLREARRSLKDQKPVSFVEEDFLAPSNRRFDYIIGNPPYVSLTSLSPEE